MFLPTIKKNKEKKIRILGTPSQRILIWPHYKRVHVNSQQCLYNLAARAAETSCFQQQNSITQLRVKAH